MESFSGSLVPLLRRLDTRHLNGPWSKRVTLIIVRLEPPSVKWTLSFAVTSELPLNQTKEVGDPEAEQTRVTELLNSTKSVLLLVINIFETDSKRKTKWFDCWYNKKELNVSDVCTYAHKWQSNNIFTDTQRTQDLKVLMFTFIIYLLVQYTSYIFSFCNVIQNC